MRYEIIIDPEETPNKCTIAPLSYRPDFDLIWVNPQTALGPLRSEILLHHEGQCLTSIQTTQDQVGSLATIDCVWRRLDILIQKIEKPLPVLVSIPNGFETAYPRRSKQNTDPMGGLATIEAIFVASAFLGIWDLSLLSEYYFSSQFIERNKKRFLELGIQKADGLQQIPSPQVRRRNSMQRRQGRGKRSGKE